MIKKRKLKIELPHAIAIPLFWAHIWQKPWFKRTHAPQNSLKHCSQYPRNGSNPNVH